MTEISERLRKFLREHHVEYRPIHHTRDYTAQQAAADTHTPGREFAKTVIVSVDGKPAMAVLPAHHSVDLESLREALGAEEVSLAGEQAIAELCPDCEVGAEPPFGNLYGLPVYVSRALTGDEEITFKAGTHEDVVRMRYRDFRKLVKPMEIEFSVGP